MFKIGYLSKLFPFRRFCKVNANTNDGICFIIVFYNDYYCNNYYILFLLLWVATSDSLLSVCFVCLWFIHLTIDWLNNKMIELFTQRISSAALIQSRTVVIQKVINNPKNNFTVVKPWIIFVRPNTIEKHKTFL